MPIKRVTHMRRIKSEERQMNFDNRVTQMLGVDEVAKEFFESIGGLSKQYLA